MKKPPFKSWVLGSLFLSAISQAALSPEKQTLEISKLLKPIPNDVWMNVAGSRSSERYAITSGDTLWDISKRLFGDPKYWPKIWSFNNDSITNPHYIKPGRQIAFMSGTGTTLPGVAIGAAPSDQPSNDPHALQKFVPAPAQAVAQANQVAPAPVENIPVNDSTGKSQEWRLLGKQSWETINLNLPQNVDSLAYDNAAKIRSKKSRGLTLEVFASTDEIDSLGEIVGAKYEGLYLTVGDLIYIEATSKLKVGASYAITKTPKKVKGDETGNNAYAYRILGTVQIQRQAENQKYIGRIIASKDIVNRDDLLIPMPRNVRDLDPIPGPAPLKAAIIIDRAVTSYETAQHKLVFIDRGSEDGIKPGMVFRNYQHRDRATDNYVLDGEIVPYADFKVMHVSKNICTALVIDSFSTLKDDLPVTLLTNVSDLNRKRLLKGYGSDIDSGEAEPVEAPTAEPSSEPTPLAEPSSEPAGEPSLAPVPEPSEEPVPAPSAAPIPAPSACPPNDIDCLGVDDSLRKDEERELKQLEDFKDEPKTAATPPAETAPPPPPPPPETASSPEPSPEDLAPPPEP